MRKITLIIGFVSTCISLNSFALELSGNVSVQQRSFFNEPLDPRQHNNYSSIAFEPELYHSWDEGDQSITFKPFHRYDQHDEERTHSDIRELSWLGVFDGWEMTLGISKVYWGVTETQHLVDIINQTDQVENIDGEDKLGQGMLRLSTVQDWGILDFFILPGFRERTFAGVEGRPRPPIPPGFTFNPDAASYESNDGQHHIDYAIRWFRSYDEWELGLSHFTGTNREPGILPTGSALAPYYDLIDQTGLVLQALVEDWTWKLEMISRKDSVERFTALTAGFEYTIVGINDTNADLGIVIEYLYDDRDEFAAAPFQRAAAVFQNDLTTAFRFTLNDIQSSELLLGITTDLDDQVIATFVEGNRRFGSSLKASLEIRTFNNTVATKPLYYFRDDDHVLAELAWYF